jgi:hypothetical protein
MIRDGNSADDWNSAQVEAWHRLHERVAELLAKYGTENPVGDGDYWINEDNYGWHRITIGVQNLKLLRPEIISALRGLLVGLPNWEIVVTVDVVGTEKVWPNMGLTIRHHEIIDGLQRKYFPVEFQGFGYANSRSGTASD